MQADSLRRLKRIPPLWPRGPWMRGRRSCTSCWRAMRRFILYETTASSSIPTEIGLLTALKEL